MVPLNQGKHFARKPCFHRLLCCLLSAQSLASEVHGYSDKGTHTKFSVQLEAVCGHYEFCKGPLYTVVNLVEVGLTWTNYIN
jgi:hypothetical protein